MVGLGQDTALVIMAYHCMTVGGYGLHPSSCNGFFGFYHVLLLTLTNRFKLC